MMLTACRDWLPSGKQAAVCFSIDDVHPAGAADGFDAGGDLGRGALGRVERLLERHPRLRVTLFVTPDWRRGELVRTRGWPTRVPLLRQHVQWAPLAAPGRFRLDRFPEFVAYLNGLPRTDCAVHGLHHAHPGARLATEFQRQSRRKCRALVGEARRIFVAAGLRHVPGFAAPGWNTPPALCAALSDADFRFVASARDLDTPVSAGARTAGSGLHGAALIQPTWISVGAGAARRLLHFATNFQASSPPARAHAIIEAGGLLLIKAHVFKHGGGITLRDGLDEEYCAYLERSFAELERRYGERLWWPSLDEVTDRCRATAA
jgi:hypothetical protein